MKHSPAPWKYESLRGWPGDSIYDKNGEPIVYELATPNGDGSANGRLIAAAPDLLEALKQARGFIRLFTDGNGFTIPHDIRANPVKLWNMMDAVIARAEPPDKP
jgi:hypothetical protein